MTKSRSVLRIFLFKQAGLQLVGLSSGATEGREATRPGWATSGCMEAVVDHTGTAIDAPWRRSASFGGGYSRSSISGRPAIEIGISMNCAFAVGAGTDAVDARPQRPLSASVQGSAAP